MAKFPEKDNSFIVFHNDDKKNDNSPDWKGTGKFNGQNSWVSIWVKQGKKGKFITGSVTRADERETVQEKINQENDIPFN